MYHKSEQETSFGCRGAIAVKACTMTLHEFDFCRFDIGVCDYIWYLRAATRQERDRWITALEEQIRAIDEEDRAITNITSIRSCNDIANSNATSHIQQLPNQSIEQQNLVQIENQPHMASKQMTRQQASQQAPNCNPDTISRNSYNYNLRTQQQLEQHLQQSDNFSDAQEHFEDPLVDISEIPQSMLANQELAQENFESLTGDSNDYDPLSKKFSDGIASAHTDNIETIQAARPQPQESMSFLQNSAILDGSTNVEANNNDCLIDRDSQAQEDKRAVPSNPLWPKIDQITRDQLYHAQAGLGRPGTTDGWQLFAEDGLMRLYSRELEIDGLVCDPLKAVHVVKGITGYEMCHRFFSPDTRFEWEQTLESMKVVEKIDDSSLVFHQVHKRIWPAAQRDAVFWSHMRKIENPQPSCLSHDDINLTTRPDLTLLNIWIVCNNSIERPDIPVSEISIAHSHLIIIHTLTQ